MCAPRACLPLGQPTQPYCFLGSCRAFQAGRVARRRGRARGSHAGLQCLALPVTPCLCEAAAPYLTIDFIVSLRTEALCCELLQPVLLLSLVAQTLLRAHACESALWCCRLAVGGL